MIKRLNVCIFHPRLIAQFINDRFLQLFYYFAILLVVASTASFFSTTYANSIGSSNEALLASEIKSLTLDEEILFSKNKLVGNPSFSLTVGQMVFSFGDTQQNFSKILFNFEVEEVSLIMGGFVINTIRYDELSVSDFSINEASVGSTLDINLLINLINRTYSSLMKVMWPLIYIAEVAITVGTFALCVLILYLFSANINPVIPKKFRFKIVLYSSTIILVCDIFSYLFLFMPLRFLGAILAYYFVNKALRAILRIEYKKV